MNKPLRGAELLRLHPLAAAVLCASSALAALPAHAQDTQATRLDTVSVQGAATSPGGEVRSDKFTAPLRDTPQTVQVIPQEVFNQQGAQSLIDVLGNTPGISFNAGENGFSTGSNNFQLRGFDSSGNIFVDGVRDSGVYTRDVFNVEQVEVVKGPAADNGRGGPGGYVNLVTKTPQLRDFNNLTLSYGLDEYDGDNSQRLALDTNRVVAEGAAVRLNLLAQNGGVPGRAIAEKNTLGVAPSLALGLNTDTRLILALQYLEQDDVPDWGVPASFVRGMKGSMPYGSTRRSDRDRFYGLASDYDEVTAHVASVRVEHDLSSNLTLTNQLRWSETSQDARYTVVFNNVTPTQLNTQTQFYDRRNESISNQTGLTARFNAGGFNHTLSTGVEISRETSDANRFGTITSTVGIGGDPYRDVPGLNASPTQKNHVTIDTVAAYVYDTVELNDQWQVTGGLRAERYEAEIKSRDLAGGGIGNLDGVDVSDTTLGGKLGLVFKPAENGSIYASVGLSTLPPGSWLSNPDISRTGDNAFPGNLGAVTEDQRTQRALNYELGTKWEFFDSRLSTTAAVFRTERSNVAITGRDVSGAGETSDSLKGYGKHIVQGLELSATGRIDNNWSVLGGVAFIDSEREVSAELDRMRCEANPGDYQAGGTVADCGGIRTNGDELAFTPKVTANLWTTYEWQNGFTAGLGARYVSSSYLGRPDDATRIIPNGRFGKLPSYTVFNAMASYRVSEYMVVRLNIENLTDELYATSANWPGQRVDLGLPRSYLLSADISF